MNILLVDDEKELVSTLAERLSFRGVIVDWTASAKEALEMAEKKNYDLAVLDVKMPGLDGFKLKRILQEKHPNMKFIFLTGHGSEDYYRVGSAETGAEYYLVKPVQIDDLIDKMKKAFKEQGEI
jgi:DNA-binding response OmpR family regulator